jgi:hypothetical protein
VDDCKTEGGEWVNQTSNFDNILNAMVLLFEIITKEGWMDVMYNGIDSTGVGLQPKLNNSPILIIYFVSFIIAGNIFMLNLFVGVVIDKFNRLKDRLCGYALMT